MCIPDRQASSTVLFSSSGVLRVHLREAVRRETAQAEAKGERDGVVAVVRETTGPVPPPKNIAGHSSGRGMPGHISVRHGTNFGQSGECAGVSGARVEKKKRHHHHMTIANLN